MSRLSWFNNTRYTQMLYRAINDSIRDLNVIANNAHSFEHREKVLVNIKENLAIIQKCLIYFNNTKERQ